jgi:hypothetical protein
VNRNLEILLSPEGNQSTYSCSSKPGSVSESRAHLLSPSPRMPNDDAPDDLSPLLRPPQPKLVVLHVADIGSEGCGGGHTRRADASRGKNFSPRKTTIAEVDMVDCSLAAHLTHTRSFSIRHCLLQQLWMQQQQQHL